MPLYHSSKQKVRNIQRTIDSLLDGDFPLAAGRKALEKLRLIFRNLDEKLDRAHRVDDGAAERQYAQLVNLKVYQTLPILGFILRSTNVRNAFELLDPLQQIASKALQGKPQLLLSSEWDYVPFAYPQNLDDLRSFILIGMPASESSSALLIPLAGHELGHAVWRNRGIGGGVSARVQERCIELYNADRNAGFRKHFPSYDPNDILAKELFPEAIALSVRYAAFQAEELFCDMFAYALFGESFLYAFSYILAPGSGRVAGSKYPSHRTRINVLTQIASNERVDVPRIEALQFADELPRNDPQERYIVRIAETTVAEIIPSLWERVKQIVSEEQICRPEDERAQKHLTEFRLGIPAHSPKCIGDVINAGWKFYKELQRTCKPKADISPATVDALNEMVLKTIEVLEFRRRIEN